MVVQRAQFEEMLVHRGKKDDHVDLLKNKVKKYEKERVVLLSAMFAFSLCCCFHDGSSFVFPNKLYFKSYHHQHQFLDLLYYLLHHHFSHHLQVLPVAFPWIQHTHLHTLIESPLAYCIRSRWTEAPASLQREIVGRESTRERRERREREEQHINEMQWERLMWTLP